MSVLRAIIAAAGLVAAGIAAADVRYTERVQPYGVSGGSPQDLRAQMDLRGRRAMDGGTYDANTASDLKWQFTYQTTSDDCRIGDALVLVDVTYHVPAWTGQNHAPRDARERWDAFLERLMAHERTHGAHARQAGEELERALLTTPAGRYCEEVGKAANERAADVVRKLRRTDAEYDERTKHGYTEGAVFLP
jgi:predicted secreted Zn-dependent protease